MKSLIDKIHNEADTFLNALFEHIEKTGLDVKEMELDHICYRTPSIERYKELKSELFNHGSLLTESQINGRPIVTLKLDKGISFNNRIIDVLELPAPKVSNKYKEGFEHIEFVIDCDLTTFQQRYSQIEFDESELSKVINPSLRIKFGDMSVKFHEHSLEYVIKYLD